MSNIKDFINNFNTSNPDWSFLPEDFPDCDLSGLESREVGKFNSIKVTWELSTLRQAQGKPKQRSRVWTDPEGYKYLVQWSNTVLLRFLVRKFTDSLPKSEYKRKAQLDDAARSTVRNIEEGYKRPTTSEYIDFIGYSQASLEEVKGDIRELTEDGFLSSRPGSSLTDLGIDLGEFNKALKAGKGSYKKLEDDRGELKETKGEEAKKPWDYRPLEVLYPPLKDIRAEDLTYEIFMELINKTDYLLRGLIESLEKKMYTGRKGYQIEQSRIKDKFRKK